VTVADLEDLIRAREAYTSGAAQLARRHAGLSLAEVGEYIGCSPMTVLRWERLENSPRREHAAGINRFMRLVTRGRDGNGR
jgi:transcriptional regulator with XRE-family HTH domain